MDTPNMDNDYMDKTNHQKNQFSFFEEKVSPNQYENYEDSEVNFQQTVEDVSSYNTMVEVNQPIIMEEPCQVSKSLNVTRSYKSPLNVEQLVGSDRMIVLEEEEDQPSLQSPAPRKQEFNQIQKSADFRDAFSSAPKDESSADRYKVQHVIKGLKHQTSCRPASQYIEQSKEKNNRQSSQNSRYEEKQDSWEKQKIPCSDKKPQINKKIIEFPDSETPIKDGSQTERSRSINAQFGCIQAADVQAHLEHLRQRNMNQSPFQNLKDQPHFETLYKLRIQQQLSPFEQNLPMTPTSLMELTQTNPLAQSMRHSIASNSMAQMLSSSMQGLPNTGQQYEVLLNERQGLQNQIGELQKQVEESKKVINQLKTQISLQKIEITEKDEDLEEAKNSFNQRSQDFKATIERLNETIADQARKLIDSQTKERQSSNSLENLKKKNADLLSTLDSFKKDKQKQGQQDDGKGKEIYSLTVELGCLREENSEFKKNILAQREDFEQRMQDQRDRANEEYQKFMEEIEELRGVKEQEIAEANQKIEMMVMDHQIEVQELNDKIGLLQSQKRISPIKDQFTEKLDTIKSEKSFSAERYEPVHVPPCTTKAISSPDLQESSHSKYLKQTSEFGKLITEGSIIENHQEHRIIPISPPVKSDFAESFDERKPKEYSPFRHDNRGGLQRCQSDFGIKMGNHLNKSQENSVRASQEVRQSLQTIQRPLNAHATKHNFNRPSPSIASNLIAQRRKNQKSAGKAQSSVLSQSFMSQRSTVSKTTASKIGTKAREQKMIRKDPDPKFQENLRSLQKSPLNGSQTTRGHLDHSRTLVDASNRITTPRKDQPLASTRLTTSRQTGTPRKDQPLASSRLTTSRQTGRASPKPMLSSRVSYNPPVKKPGNEENTDMKQKLQSIQTGKAYLEKKIQEYESRLTQMKNKKEKSRACLIGGPKMGFENRNNSRSHLF